MRFLDSMFVVMVGASMLAACGGDDDDGDSSSGSSGGQSSSGGSSGGGSSNGGTSGGSSEYSAQELAAGACEQGESNADCDIQPYVDCVTSSCSDQYEMCLGAGYMSGNFSGGACESYMECVSSAPDQCDHDCTQDQACQDCFITIGNCAASNCASELSACTGGAAVGGDIGAIGGGTCEDLEGCCASLSGDDQTTCNSELSMVRAAGDLGCGAVYSIYQLGGMCQ